MKIKKHYSACLLITSFALLLSFPTTVNASVDFSKNGYGDPNESEIRENKELTQKKEQLGKRALTTKALSDKKQLDVTAYKQETSYWCGPAAAQMVIRYVDGRYISQSVLARDMGTTYADGTYVYRLRQELNAYRGINDYYAEANIMDKSLYYAIQTTVSDNHPVVPRVFTNDLNPNYSFNTGHYVVISGFDYTGPGGQTPLPSSSSLARAKQPTVTYNDPWTEKSIFGKRTVNYSIMREAVNDGTGNGWFIW